MIIVSNTGPIIGLAKIGHLFVLNRLAKEVLIPPRVHRELLGKTGPEAALIDQALDEFIRVREAGLIAPAVEKVLRGVDEGEKQAVCLAHGLPGSLLLMDDRVGREAAKELNQALTGTGGLLLLAKQSGFVTHVSPLMDALRASGYWVSDEILMAIKNLAKE